MNRFENNRYFREPEDEAVAFKMRLLGKTRGEKKKVRNWGAILTFLFSISDYLLILFRDSALGHFLSDIYYEWNEKWREGAIFKFFKYRKGSEGGKRVGFRVRFARVYETSVICHIVSIISEKIIHSYVRLWGMGVFTLAFMMIFAAMVKYYFSAQILTENLLLAAGLILLSAPLIISKKRLGETLMGGLFSRYVAIEILGLDETKYEKDETKSGGNYLLMLAASAFLGLLTYVISPWIMVAILLLISGFALIMCYPELGIVTALSMIPFSNIFERPSLTLALLVGASLISYFFKLMRGKRVIRFELLDMFVVAFAILILFGGIITSGGIASFNSAVMYTLLICIYPLVVNAYIRKTWIYRGMKLIVFSTSIMALIGVLEGGVANSSWIDNTVFADIGERVGAFLGNPNMLGVYLVIVFPLILGHIASAKRRVSKFLYLSAAAIVLLCLILTWSRGAWLGLIVGTLIFILLYNFRNIWFVIAGLVTCPLWITFLPTRIIERLQSILTMSDSSIIYRFNTWYGALHMAWDNLISGVGVGESAFINSYYKYAVSGTETVMHSHNLYLEILIEMGIFAFLIFLAIMFMFSQKCFSSIKSRSYGSKSRIMISAGYAGIAGALVMGLTDYIWYNYRVFLIFWAVMALTVALVKVNDSQRAKDIALNENNSVSATVDI